MFQYFFATSLAFSQGFFFIVGLSLDYLLLMPKIECRSKGMTDGSWFKCKTEIGCHKGFDFRIVEDHSMGITNWV